MKNNDTSIVINQLPIVTMAAGYTWYGKQVDKDKRWQSIRKFLEKCTKVAEGKIIRLIDSTSVMMCFDGGDDQTVKNAMENNKRFPVTIECRRLRSTAG